MGHKVFNRAVGETNPVSVRVALGALAILWLVILRLGNTGKRAVPHEFDRIERILCGCLEFFRCRKPGRFAGILHRETVRQGEEQSVIGFSRVLRRADAV